MQRSVQSVAYAFVGLPHPHNTYVYIHHRLENGLAKLHKTQGEVDVLIEAAKKIAVEVEIKVANANVFAEQVSHTCRGCCRASRDYLIANLIL